MIEKILALMGYVIAGIVGVLHLRLRRKYESEAKLREMRFKVYREYLAKLDSIHENLRLDFGEFNRIFQDVFESILQQNPAGKPLIELQRHLSEFSNKSIGAANQSVNELNGLRLVCSQSILNILDEYIKLAKEQLDESGHMLKSINFLIPSSFSYIESFAAKNNFKHLRLDQLKSEIHLLMRQDIINL